MTQRFRAKIVCHNIPSRTVICSICGAAWEERYIGVATTAGEPAPVCPRCIPLTLTAGGMIEAEISITLLASDADPAAIRRNITERYAEFIALAAR